jgi:hypothetical protein
MHLNYSVWYAGLFISSAPAMKFWIGNKNLFSDRYAMQAKVGFH